MKKGLLEIYALAVCFFTLLCFVITFGLALWNIVEITYPEFTIYSTKFECHQSDAAYKECNSSKSKYTREENPIPFPTGKELTTEREQKYATILKSEQRSAVQGIVQKLIIMFIDIIAFAFHWKLAARARKNS